MVSSSRWQRWRRRNQESDVKRENLSFRTHSRKFIQGNHTWYREEKQSRWELHKLKDYSRMIDGSKEKGDTSLVVAKILDGIFADIDRSRGDELHAKRDEVDTVQIDVVSEIDSIEENIVSIFPVESSTAEFPSSSEVMDLVMQQVSILLNTTNVPTDVPLMDMDLHSFGSAELAACLSIVFNLKITPAFLYDHPTIEEIVTFITEELQQLRKDEENALYDTLNDIAVAEDERKEGGYHIESEKEVILPVSSPSTPRKSTCSDVRTPEAKPFATSFDAVTTTPSSQAVRTPSNKCNSERLSRKYASRSPYFELAREEYIFIGDSYMHIDAMSGMALYKKTQNFNDVEFISAMESALATVLDLNPILTGCIVQKNDSSTGQNGIFVKPKCFQLKDIFTVTHVKTDKSFKIPSEERNMAMYITSTCEHLITRLGTGYSQKKNKSPLCSIKVINLPDNEHVVLQLSVSHAIADGYTISKIVSQINQSLQGEIITPLRWVMPSIVDNRIFSLFEKTVIFVWALLFKVLDNLFLSLWSLSSLRAGFNFVIVNNAVVDKIRSQIRSSSHKHVSDNDIILSALSRKMHKSVVMYLVNLRYHVDGITADLAGNWIHTLMTPKNICADPSNVRNLSSMHDVFQQPVLLDFTNFLQLGLNLNTNISEYDLTIHFPSQLEFICFIPLLDGMRRQPCARNTVTFKLNSDTTMVYCGCQKTYRELLTNSDCNNDDPYDEIFISSKANNNNGNGRD